MSSKERKAHLVTALQYHQEWCLDTTKDEKRSSFTDNLCKTATANLVEAYFSAMRNIGQNH